MNRVTMAGLLAAAAVAVGVTVAHTREAKPVEPMIGHMVYFKLNDGAPAAKLVEACDKYLTGHPGVTFYAAGTVGKEFTREVNDRDWDVALHVVFQTKADHDKYQDAPRHLKFIEENKATWKKVRVFDSLIAAKK